MSSKPTSDFQIFNKPHTIGADPVHMDGKHVMDVRMHGNIPQGIQAGSISQCISEEVQRAR